MKKSNKLLSLLLTLALMFTMCFGTVVTSFADTTSNYSVTVSAKIGEKEASKTLTNAEITALPKTTEYFSGINNQGSVKDATVKDGVTVETILGYALQDASFGAIAAGVDLKKLDNVVITFSTSSGDATSFYFKDFFATKYAYTKASLEAANVVKGKVDTSKLVASEVSPNPVPIFELGSESKLYFGQSYASERNWPGFWGGVLEGGKIEITAGAKKTCADPVASVTSKNIAVGSTIDFTSGKGEFVYYTTDGSDPTDQTKAYIYNYAPKIPETQPVVVAKKIGSTLTVKAVAKAAGKNDSAVKTFKYTVVPKQAAISSVTAGAKKFTAKFDASAKSISCDGYQVKYSTDNKKWSTVTVSSKKTSATVSKLKKNKTYYVKARAYKTVKKTKYYGAYSEVQTVKTK